MASVLDSPAANTRSKADGPRLGKPKRMAVLGDASDAANKRSKVSRSATESKQEAAAERRWQAQERKKADVAQKKAERDAAMAKRKAEREAAAGAGRPGRTGSGDSVGAGRPGRTGSGDSASGRLGRTGSGEGRPNTARGGVKPRQPRGKAPAGLPERDPYDYKKRLEDMEGVLAKIVGANSSESEAGVTVESAPKGLEANVTALSEKQAAAAAQVAELTEKLKQVEESKAAALEGAEKAKEQELARLHAEAAAAAATHTVALAELQAKFESMTRDTEQLRTQLAGRESELAAMRSTVDTQAANLVAVKAQADATESALQAEKTAHAATTARAMGAEETVVQRDAMIVELEAKAKEDEKLRKKLHNTIQELKGNIRVFCRIRPGAEQSTASGEPDLFEVNGAKALAINDPNGRADMAGDIKNRSFDFAYDHVFGPDSRQDDVFEEISQLVQSALDGYKVCIFCYGQTGSGKTFTMQGPEGKEALSPGSELAGMIPRSCEQIFATAAELSTDGWSFSVTASFLEIYNESLFDLLGTSDASSPREKLEIRMEKGKQQTHVPNLTTCAVESPDQVYELLERASASRVTAATAMNERSSRSHSVFQLKLSGVNSETGEKAQGVLNLVDLAGSERLAQSKAQGERQKETLAINKSLSSLGDCICALANGDKHVPYRNSKLTHYLAPYLGGEAKTLMFVNVAAEKTSFNESLCSLRFASKVNACEIGTARKTNKVQL